MNIPIPVLDAPSQTSIVIAILGIGVTVGSSIQTETPLTNDRTQELKGVAILAVLCAHIGYYLVDDHHFLFPLSSIAGIALNTFLFLSGYGLVKSALRQPLTPIAFYRRRLLTRLYIPFWIALAATIIWRIVVGASVPWQELPLAILGLFPSADIYAQLNSPLWYFTLIVLHYLLFPVLFSPKRPLASSLLMLTLGSILSFHQLPLLHPGVDTLYRLHLLALPLGMMLASLPSPQSLPFRSIWRWFLLTGSIALFIYSATHAHIGEGIVAEAAASLVGTFSLIATFLLKPLKLPFLALFGSYSYEIYLLHWPLLLQDRWLFGHLPASVSLMLWLLLLFMAAVGLHTVTTKLFVRVSDRVVEQTHTR